MTQGLELCDANLQAAVSDGSQPTLLRVATEDGASSWPGYALRDGNAFVCGQAAEDVWLIRPRNVIHSFWSKLSLEPTALTGESRPLSYSEIAYTFLRHFSERLRISSPSSTRMALAVPGAYLRDPAVAEEKVGLLLGMAADLKLPLCGIVDLATASLCDPRAPRFNPARPVIHLDLHLHAAELSLLVSGERLERRAFLHLPGSGLIALLKHLTGTMANRFLRQTSFDVMADGRTEQLFYNQTKSLFYGNEADFVYQINTARRGYELPVKRDSLGADAQAFTEALLKSILAFTEENHLRPGLCAVALSERAGRVPLLEARLRTAGFVRFLHLPAGAAAAGAAQLAGALFATPTDLADVPVVTSVPSEFAARRVSAPWDVHVRKARANALPHPPPTHLVLEGLGLSLAGRDRVTIGTQGQGATLPLPESFNPAANCCIALERIAGHWQLEDPAPAEATGDRRARIDLETGDRLVFRTGSHTVDVLLAHCPTAN
jgi:hypothetical protein